jgi:hypothetical protein
LPETENNITLISSSSFSGMEDEEEHEDEQASWVAA